MKQKLTLLFLFLAAGISMAHTIDFDHFGKENLDNTGNINYLVKNIEKEIAADEFQLTSVISREKDVAAQSLAAIKNQGHDAHFKALIIAKGEVGNLTTALIQKFDGFGNLQTWVKNLDEVADAKLLAKLNDLDKGYFEALDGDLADVAFKNAIEKNAELVGAWEVLEKISFRTDIKWLESFHTLKKNDLLNLVDEVNEVEIVAIHRYTVNNYELTYGAYTGTLTPKQKEWIDLINSGLDKLRPEVFEVKCIEEQIALNQKLLKSM